MGWHHSIVLGVMDRDDHLLQSLPYDVQHILPIHVVHLQCLLMLKLLQVGQA